MVKKLEVEEGKVLTFKASAFSPIQYNNIFPGGDFLRDMSVLEKVSKEMKAAKEEEDENTEENSEAINSVAMPMDVYKYFVRIAYLFAYQGLAPTPRQTQEQRDFLEKYPDPWMWIDNFNTFSIYELLPEIMEMWHANEKQEAIAKKANPIPPGK